MIRAAHKWPSNAEMIADVAKLGYINGLVLDPTYGEGVFWKVFRPEGLIWTDIKEDNAWHKQDFTDMPWGDEWFDTVVFDPPYKLNGTPSEPDVRYGVGEPERWQDRVTLCHEGGRECIRVLKGGGHLLWKTMDQVCSGKVRWLTWAAMDIASHRGCELVDRFDLLHEPRKQPGGRRQVHAARCYSTLLVFRKV